MSDLFAKLENDRYMRQDGAPVYKYHAPYLHQRAYRMVVDMMYRPEFLVPLTASFLGAAAATFGAPALIDFGANLKTGASTLVMSVCLGFPAASFSEQMMFNFQRPLGIVHSYFDKRPEKDDITDDGKIAASKMKRLHQIFSGIAVGGVGVAIAKFGLAAEFVGPATGLIAGSLAHRSRYAKVEREEWAFYDPRGGPPRGRKMPETEKRPVQGVLAPNLIR